MGFMLAGFGLLNLFIAIVVFQKVRRGSSNSSVLHIVPVHMCSHKQ